MSDRADGTGGSVVSRFRVERMDCGAEEQLVRMALDTLDGVDRVTIDLAGREVVVRHSSDTAVVDAALQRLDLGTILLDDAPGDALDDPDLDASVGEASPERRQRRALAIALVVNLAFFVGELSIGLISGSMGLVADALDMGADASVYALSLMAVGGVAARKLRLARLSGWLQLGLALVGLAEVVRRFAVDGSPPEPEIMIVVSSVALIANLVVLVLIHGVRTGEAHLQASWIFTANDLKANTLVILAGVAVWLTDSALPDLVAGGIIFLVVANGARRILRLSRPAQH